MGSAPGSGSAQIDARQGGRGGEDVHPINVRAVPPSAIVPDVWLDQSAQCVECEVLVLRFARRQSCAEPIWSPAEWA